MDAEELSLSGSVKDRTGAVVRAAQVSLMNAHGGVLATVRTGDEGTFAFGPVAPGRYLLGTRASGVASYVRSQQDGGKRYDQLLGGGGNLVADLRNLILDRASLKYDRAGLGPFGSFSIGYSYTAQREDPEPRTPSSGLRGSVS